MDESSTHVCVMCGAAAGFRCGGCLTERYCTAAHQKAAWVGGHKRECRRAKLTALPLGDLRASAMARGLPASDASKAALIDMLLTAPRRVAPTVEESAAAAAAFAGKRVDWSVDDGGAQCLSSMLKRAAFGDCDSLVMSVAALLGVGDPHAGSEVIHRDEFSASVLRTVTRDVHAQYYVFCNAASFSFLFETRAGRARVWMAWVANDAPGFEGYTSAQWAAARPARGWSPGLVAAHARWGGSRELDDAGLRALVAAVLELQDATDAVAAGLCASLSPALVEAERAWMEARRESRTPRGAVLANAGPAAEWTRAVMHSPGYPSTVSVVPPIGDCPLAVLSNGAWRGPLFHLSAPTPVVNRFVDAHLALTGQLPSAHTYLQALHHVHWRNIGSLSDCGQVEALSWGYKAGIVPDRSPPTRGGRGGGRAPGR